MPEAATAEPGPGRAPERTQPEKVTLESPGLLSDCRLMLSYARKNGFEIPAELLYEISWLDGVLATLNISPISAISTALLTPVTNDEIAKGFRPRATALGAAAPPLEREPEDPDVEAPATEGLSPEEMVLRVHAKLSTLITPTTALSLQTSEPPPGKAHIFGGMPPLVQNIIWVALGSAFFFILSAAFIAQEAGVARDAKAADKAASAAPVAALKASQPAPAPSATAPKAEPGASK